MSYASFLKSVPEILSQPTGIAALASLGIHGAIAFMLPLMPVESAKSNKQATQPNKPVSLSELSSTEQSRIPQQSPTAQPGVQSQLPPLPNQIAGLPTQQQIPLNVPGASAGLPPSPPLGSTGSPLLPSGSNSSAFTPLEKASGLSISPTPRGGNVVQRFRNDLNFDASRYGSTPRISSRINPGISSGISRNSGANFGYGRQSITTSRPDRLAELPNTVSTNIPVNPPPLPTGDMTPPPIVDPAAINNNSLNSNYGNLNPTQQLNENRVEPNNGYITPITQNQTPKDGNFKIAGSTPLPTYQPQSGGALDNLNRPNNKTELSAAPTGNSTSLTNTQQNSQQGVTQLDDSTVFQAFKKEYPQGQLRAPIDLPIDQAKLDRNARVAVVVNGENKIDDFKLLGDAAKLPFPTQQVIRERLQQYFKENPTSTNGKGALFSFQLFPGQSNATQSNSVGTAAVQNNQAPQTPQARQDIMQQLSGATSNSQQPVVVPQVNNPTANTPINASRTNSSTQLPVLPPSLPGPIKTIGSPQGQATAPNLPLQKPNSSTNLPPTLRKVEPAPEVAPTQRSNQSQNRTTTSQSSRNALVTKLRGTHSSESETEMSVVEKLRRVKQQRENANP
jgi:hypothetical protein